MTSSPRLSVPRLSVAAASDQGRMRSNNEDYVLTDLALAFALLADGMGGANAGEVASRIAVESVAARLRAALPVSDLDAASSLLRSSIEAASADVLAAATGHAERQGLGATFVALLLQGRHALVAHVGDSRLYRLRDGQLEALTRDHSLVRKQLDMGLITSEQARLSSLKNIITQAMGKSDGIEVELQVFEWLAADRFLLCSDGLSDMLTDADIAELMRRHAEPQACVQALIDAANAAGGRDNISAIVLRAAESSS